jgi:nucleotide-binding universal stress UspA family protein
MSIVNDRSGARHAGAGPRDARPGSEADPAGEVLIASHGGTTGAAAIRLGRTIAARWNAPVEIIGVLTPVALYPPEVAIDVGALEELEEAALRDQLLAQAGAVGGAGAAPPVRVLVGGPAEILAEVARERHASIIVVGLGQRDLLDRLLGGQTPIQVLRHARVPVLAVAPDAGASLPRTVVIATDFSDHAARAGRIAVSAAADDATIHLVHVEETAPRHGAYAGVDAKTLQSVIDAGATALLGTLRESLSVRGRQALRASIVRGQPARAVLQFAADVHADLIVLGSHGRRFPERLLLGSVAETLLRSASCSVLVASARTADAAAAPSSGHDPPVHAAAPRRA